ncbi:MAG: diacylglycerol kinase [Chthonomonas sp.]|nr:diacylglycerol kinase [Chthonomonas sp.]
MPSPGELVHPFRVAISGLVHTFRTQRHMRVHLYITMVTVLLAMAMNLRVREVLILLFMINFVLVAEMFNSAIEATVDLASPNYHPLAKFAKDIAAGAVLVTTIMAIVVGALIALGSESWERIRLSLSADTVGLPFAAKFIVGLFALFILIVVGKGLGKRGQVLHGGLVSGHAAYGFYLAGAVVFISDRPLVSGIAILLAIILAQSRWEAKIHSVFELTLGATVGLVVALLLFGFLPK